MGFKEVKTVLVGSHFNLVAVTENGEEVLITTDVANYYGAMAGRGNIHRFQKIDCRYYHWDSDTNTIELEQ